MARNVNTQITPMITLHINVFKEDGSVVEREINIEDMVTDLRYAANGQNNKVSGRVSNIAYKVERTKRLYTSVAKAKSWFKVDVTPTILYVDTSKEYHSDVREIDVRELLEDSGVTGVKRITSYLSYGFHGEVLRSDDTVNTFDVKEGDILSDICYLFRGDETTLESAKLIAIKRDGVTLKPVALVLNLNNKLRTITIDQLVSIGEAGQPIDETEKIMDSIDKTSTDPQVLFIGPGTFNEAIEVTNNVSIRGNKVGIWGTSKNRDHVTFEDETIISGGISVKEGGKLEIDGCVLTQEAFLNLASGASEISVQNCIICGLGGSASKTYFLKGLSTEPTKVTIENCYFGDNPKTASKVYNMFEMNFPLRTDSKISGNYFTKDACTHNFINIYGVVDDAVIEINDNVFEYSGSAIRLGAKGSPKNCTININNLTYNSTDESEDCKWAGMMIVQPYKHDTVSMEGIRVNINNVKRKDTHQLYFVYSSPSTGTLLTEENAPHVFVNGKEYPRLFNHIIYGDIPATVDKSALEKLITKIGTAMPELEQDHLYTYQSYFALVTERENANMIMDKADATQEEVNAQVTALQAAFDALKEVEREDLDDLIAEVTSNLAENVYTFESTMNATTALEEAENLSVGASKADVWDAYQNLYNASDNLKSVTTDEMKTTIDSGNEALARTDKTYTDESKTRLQDAITAAQAVVDNEHSTKADVDQAYVTLINAINSLTEATPEPTVSKTELTELIETANGKLTQTTIEYTDESKTVLQNAITDAQAVVDKTDATQEEVNTQVATLQSAIDQLVQKGNNPSVGEVEVTPGDDDW